MLSANKAGPDDKLKEEVSKGKGHKSETSRRDEESQAHLTGCGKCGRYGHRTEDCFKPVICKRCKKEGHVPRVCSEVLPWECIAPYCGMAAPGQGIHVILEDEYDGTSKDMSNWALISIIEGVASAKQIEGEFKAMAGPSSTWRWYAKKIAENKFQMKFPTAQKVDDLAFFTRMTMRTVPNVSFTVERWNSNVGAKAEIPSAWFRIFDIPVDKRTEKVACYVGSLVGVPLEVDKANLKRFEYVRVKIGCRDITKVPATVEGLLDRHIYDFSFQREVPTEGFTNLAGNTWTRNVDRSNEDIPSPKKPKRGGGGTSQQGGTSRDGTSFAGGEVGKQHNYQTKERVQEAAPPETTVYNLVKDQTEAREEGSANPSQQLNRKDKEKVHSDEESEDQGLRIGELISPGGSKLNFGSFQENEITNLWKLQINASKTVVINEYGSNLFKNKNDPLAVIEAKYALKSGELPKEQGLFQKEKQQEKSTMLEQELWQVNTGSELNKDTLGAQEVCPSPINGTQEPPAADISSQEEGNLLSQTTFTQGDTEDGNTSPMWNVLEREVMESDIGVLANEDKGTEDAISNCKEQPKEAGKKRKSNHEAEVAPQARQSERLKTQEFGGMKIADKAELAAKKKNLEGLQKAEERSSLEIGAMAMKETTLYFHPQGATSDDTGTVLLQ
ncbi:unnamed protein product [Urochloa humidicola]